MNIVAEYKDETYLVLTVEILPEEYKSDVDKEIKKYAKTATIRGFRTGTAPVGLIRKKMGVSLVLDVVSEKISEKVYDYVKENDINILGNPYALNPMSEESVDIECTKIISIDFELGVIPKFELNFTPAEPLIHYEVEIDDEFLNAEIQALQDQHGTDIEKEQIEEGSWIFGTLSEVSESGEVVEGGVKKVISLNPARVTNPEVYTKMYGLKKDDVIDFDIFSIHEDENEIARLLFFKGNELETLRGKKTNLTIVRITQNTPITLGEEFYKKVLGENTNALTEEAFREEISKQYKALLAGEERNRFREVVKKALTEMNPIQLPGEVIKKQMLLNKKEDDDITEENVDAVYEENIVDFRWEVIRGRIENQYPEIIPTRVEVEARIREMIQNYMSSNNTGIFEDHEVILKNMMRDNELVQKQYKEILESNRYNLLESLVPHQHAHINSTEFIKILKGEG